MALYMLGRSVKQAISQTSERIHTTLYDLISAVLDSVEPDNKEISTAVVMHLLNSHRVMGTGNFTGYRLMGAETNACKATHRTLGRQRTAGEAVC
jgi:hypothetical protein